MYKRGGGVGGRLWSSMAWIPRLQQASTCTVLGSFEFYVQPSKIHHSRLEYLTCIRHQNIGEGNGNPLQCSCLENPRDGGAWWAAVYEVAQSWTRLKQLSSSSSRHQNNANGWKHFQASLCRFGILTLRVTDLHVYTFQFSSVQSLSRVRLFATPWIAARQASLSITNSRSSLKWRNREMIFWV